MSRALIERPKSNSAQVELLVLDLPLRRIAWTFCGACGCEVASCDTTPHYRGRGNSPLCPSCADPSTWVQCDACKEESPFELMIVDHAHDAVYCPCVPVADLEFTRRAA